MGLVFFTPVSNGFFKKKIFGLPTIFGHDEDPFLEQDSDRLKHFNRFQLDLFPDGSVFPDKPELIIPPPIVRIPVNSEKQNTANYSPSTVVLGKNLQCSLFDNRRLLTFDKNAEPDLREVGVVASDILHDMMTGQRITNVDGAV